MRISLQKHYKNLLFILFALVAFTGKVYSQEQNNTVRKANAACTPDSQTFVYTGGPQAFIVPNCVTSITVEAWGGGGGGAGNDVDVGMAGGGGAYASSTLTVIPGQGISVLVGGGGGLGANGASNTGAGPGGYGLGNGGDGGDPGSSGTSGAGGGGGGGSGLISGGVILIDAAGGGGGGGGGQYSVGGAGGAGGQAGSDGASYFIYGSSTGGAVGGSADTIGGQGSNRGVGNDGGAGGGGGGGDNAGAGGGAPGCDCGGGGGGGGNSLGSTIVNGSGQTVGDGSYTNLPAGTGAGGSQGVNGGNGYLVISYCIPPALSVSSATTNPTCIGNDGVGTANVTGGTPAFSYKWNTGATTSSQNNLTAGSYTIVVTDASGCKDSTTFTLAGVPQLRDSISSYTNISVTCGNNGTATVGVKGGSGAYTYSWNTTPVQTSATATNLAAGSYTVTVLSGGCTVKTSVTISQPGAIRDSVSAATNVSCNGGSNGSAIAGIKGGSAPYSYSWTSTPAQTTDTATGLIAGNYTVHITDANGCTVSTSTVITQPAAIRDSIAKITEVLCTGQSNGTATDGVKGGTGAYTYAWNTAPVQTTSTATALPMGTYTVTITDANGCKDSTTATITQPTPVALTAAAFATTCNGSCNGYATVLPVTGSGTSPYKYTWSDGQTGATANNLCAGSYSVIVTDVNGCVHDTNPLTVTQPTPIAIAKTVSTAFCGQADGSATATISGGTPPYIYQWSNGAKTTNLTNVKPGDYCFGVEDANLCLDSICVIVPNTLGETASITSTTSVTCNGGNNGSAAGTATGGVLPYTYSWSDPAAQTTDSAIGLMAGTYTLTVTDSSGCPSKVVATVNQPALVVATPVATPATICVGDSSVLSATATGGTAPYTFTWNTGATASSITVGPASTITYTVTTADINNCPGVPMPVVVTVNPPLAVTTGSPAAMCPGFSATVFAKATGGDGTYTYTWSPGNLHGSSVSVSPAATMYYTVTVTDGCTVLPALDSMEVIVDPSPTVAFTTDTDNGCYPAYILFKNTSSISSGSIKSWNWSFGDGGSANNIADTVYEYKTPGMYTVVLTVTSDSGCVSVLTQNDLITVYDHPHTDFSASPQPTTILSPAITFTDLTTDLYGLTQWLWTFGDSTSLSNFSITQNTSHVYSDTGSFPVKLIDVNRYGCIDSITHYIIIDALFTLYIPSAFTPNDDGLNDIFAPKGTYFASFSMYIFDRWGMPVYHTTDINKGWNGSVNNTGKASPEDTYVYLIEVTDFKGLSHSYMGKVTLVK